MRSQTYSQGSGRIAMTPSRQKKITIKDVALKAGVAASVVSYVLNNSTKVSISDKTKLRIRQVAEELNYRPSVYARRLKAADNDTFALAMYEINYLEEEHFAKVYSGMIRILRPLGHSVDVVVMDESKGIDDIFYYKHRVIEAGVNGLMIFDQSILTGDIEALRAYDIPVVAIDRVFEHPRGTACMIDYDSAFAQLLEHLTQLGHRQIAFVTVFEYALQDLIRLQSAAFRRQLAQFDLPQGEHSFLYTPHNQDPAVSVDQLKGFLDRHPQVTALIAWDQMSGLALLQNMHRLGLGVPRDYSVACLNGMTICPRIVPTLTHIYIDFESIGELAARTMLQERFNRVEGPRRIDIPVELRTLESTGRCRK